MSGGQVIDGAARSRTTTNAAQVLRPPLPSVTVNSTWLVPGPYGPGGVWLIITGSPSGSVEPLLTEASTRQCVVTDRTAFVHRAIGGRLTVSTAFELGRKPSGLLTRTEYAPASLNCTFASVSVRFVLPGISV